MACNHVCQVIDVNSSCCAVALSFYFFCCIEFNVLVCDVCCNVTGINSIDCSNRFNVLFNVCNTFVKLLPLGSNAIFKCFYEVNWQKCLNLLKPIFKTLRIFKPLSSFSQSREFFFIAQCLLKHVTNFVI